MLHDLQAPPGARPPLTTSAVVDARVRWAGVAFALMGAGMVVAAVLHAMIVPEHMMEYADGAMPGYVPALFALSAGYGLTWALAAARIGTSRAWLGFGAAGALAMIVCGVVSRTVGLPGAAVEPASGAFTLAIGAEIVALTCGVFLLASGARARRVAPVRSYAFGMVGVAVAAFVVGYVLLQPAFADHVSHLLAGVNGWMWLPRHP